MLLSLVLRTQQPCISAELAVSDSIVKVSCGLAALGPRVFFFCQGVPERHRFRFAVATSRPVIHTVMPTLGRSREFVRSLTQLHFEGFVFHTSMP